MSGLKEIRIRINSVITTRQVTSAMKMVSAAKLRKAQDSIIRFRPYAQKLYEIVSLLVENCEEAEENIFVKPREVNRVLIVVLASNRGLCGAFNANVIKATLSLAHEKYGRLFKQGKVDFLTIGKHARDSLVKRKYPVVASYKKEIDKVNYEGSAGIIEFITEKYKSGYYDRVEIVYNQFKNAGIQILSTQQILPVIMQKSKFTALKYDYIIEPDKMSIINDLIPKYIKTEFHRKLLESQAAEHGSRMTAMHKATDNATELLRMLRLNYNKARQASITGEILEIVSASEALNKA